MSVPETRICNRCRLLLAVHDSGLVPSWVVTTASLALAFGHAGMWVQEELSRPYCARCRAWIVPLAVAAAALIFVVVFGIAAFWLKRIFAR